MEKKRVIIISIFIIFFMGAIILSNIYYNGKYSVYFETGTDEILLTKYVSKNEKVNEPMEPTKKGYVFIEWQIDGKKYDFDEKIKNDTVLTAKWIKEEYITITFNTDSSDKIESRKILKGNIINELPIPIKDNYEFIGWYLNDKLYNNEEIYDDITLSAKYKNDKINMTYKIGDRVIIVGKYANSAYSIEPYNKKAIGWERKIIYIIEDSEFPYVIGNNTGITGYFKANSIEKI